MLTCVGWQVTLCDPIWQVTLRSCEMDFHKQLYSAFLQRINRHVIGELDSTCCCRLVSVVWLPVYLLFRRRCLLIVNKAVTQYCLLFIAVCFSGLESLQKAVIILVASVYRLTRGCNFSMNPTVSLRAKPRELRHVRF